MASIARWARQGLPDVFVYTSSTGVYGGATGEVDEASLPGDQSPRNRILAEVERQVSKGKIAKQWFVLRLSGLYGPGRHRLLDRVRASDPTLADEPDRRLNSIYRDDAVRGVLACLQVGLKVDSQVFNLTADVASPRREVINWLIRRTRGETRPVGVPPPSGYALGRRVPDRMISNRRIRQALGWSPRYPDFKSGYEAILAAEKKEKGSVKNGTKLSADPGFSDEE